jgi:hypothetical protein
MLGPAAQRYVGAVSSVEELAEHVRVLTEFERDYRRYIEAQEAEEAGREPDLSQPEQAKLRRELLRRVDAAERAMRQADKMLRVEPPRMIGGHALTALSDQVFAHETPLFGSGEPWLGLPNGLLDTMCAALGALEDRLAEAQRTGKGLDEFRAQMDQMGEDFGKQLERGKLAPRQRAERGKTPMENARAWYHNPWVIAIGGGAIATVLGGIILAVVL